MKINKMRSRAMMTWFVGALMVGLATIDAPAQSLADQVAKRVAADIEKPNKVADNVDGIEELRRRVDEIERATRSEIESLRLLIKQQNEELARLRQTKQSGSGQQALAMDKTPEPPAPQQTQPPRLPAPANPQQPQTTEEVRQDTFNRDRESVARSNNALFDPAMQGFFEIPGTPARVKLDGFAKLDALIDPRPAGNPDQFVTTSIPIGVPPEARSANFNIHGRNTRFTVDFHSAIKALGDLRVYFELDFFGNDGGNDPRLRHFYGQLNNYLLGQTWTTLTDPDTLPDVLDAEGPASAITTRQVQFRYTQPFGNGHSLAFSAEKPITGARTLFVGGRPITPAPDFVARYRYEQNSWHFHLGSIYRALGYNNGQRDETIFGWGFNGSVGIKVFEKDNILLNGSYGHGLARYISNLAGLGLDLDLNNEANKLKALPAMGYFASYRHYWTSRVRSSFTFGYDRVQNTTPQPLTAFSKSYYMSGNLIWNPVANFNLGVEFLHGWQVLKDNSQGNANRIQISAKYDLYRKEQ